MFERAPCKCPRFGSASLARTPLKYRLLLAWHIAIDRLTLGPYVRRRACLKSAKRDEVRRAAKARL